jgi:hypothetical protein
MLLNLTQIQQNLIRSERIHLIGLHRETNPPQSCCDEQRWHPSVYDFAYAAPEWGSGTCRQYPHDEDKEGKSSVKGFVLAKGWTINPYGDIALVKNGQSREFCCAGAAPDKR